jgi:hypothetical protein
MKLTAWRRRLACLALTGMAVATGLMDTAQAEGIAAGPKYDLFYNYYEGGSRFGDVPVQMYPSPLPAPPRVGGTYYTYQALYPHEWLYPHARTYRRHKRGHIIPANTTRAVYW